MAKEPSCARERTLQPQGGQVQVNLEHPSGQTETLNVPWLVGCDGAHSFVRKAVGLPFEGEQFGEVFNLADVDPHNAPPGARRNILLSLTPDRPLFVAPLGRHIR
ncbi:FAD-dependent monooxygenase [Deinococcus sp. Arct2-2]|uniref:FAD-dependent monooxygenase n=1 Tax=Deinococcus sp. Arct2-2 TaxID=2568653 RepID=UPI0023EF54EB|nr:FAD-dependent monooxygenase [Deinococcus sp. Arct2-2]